YRRLIRNNVTGVTEKMLGRTRARMGAAFDRDFDRFLDEIGPRTHYLRDVPGEFLDWIEPQWRARDELPAWTADLARHELAEFQIGAAEGDAPAAVTEVALDRGVVFAAPVRLLRYAFAVHELASDEADRAAPRAERTVLLAYR